MMNRAKACMTVIVRVKPVTLGQLPSERACIAMHGILGFGKFGHTIDIAW